MGRSAALIACVLTSAVWAAPAMADTGYPPVGPTGGGGGAIVTQTRGSGVPSVTLPHTGTDLMTPLELGSASLVLGAGLLVVARRRRAPR